MQRLRFGEITQGWVFIYGHVPCENMNKNILKKILKKM